MTISQFLGVLVRGCPATRQIDAMVSELENTNLSGGSFSKYASAWSSVSSGSQPVDNRFAILRKLDAPLKLVSLRRLSIICISYPALLAVCCVRGNSETRTGVLLEKGKFKARDFLAPKGVKPAVLLEPSLSRAKFAKL